MTNQELIHHFYNSFAKGDYQSMINCYHTNIEFEDPAFGKLKGNDAKAMWKMLIIRSKGDIDITHSNVIANEKTGSANWLAKYTFGQTGRKVTNNVSAQFEFADGKIIKHTDTFDMWIWSKQALGAVGLLFGRTTFMKNKIQKTTNKLLADFKLKQSL